ncbi:MAG: MFS transporter [Bacteroidota bacterium]
MAHTASGRSPWIASTIAMALLILAGEAIFLLPFVLARVFRPTFLAVFGINNFELGLIFSVYGLVAIPAYLFGGPLADRFPARKLMAVALASTSGLGFLLATIPSFDQLRWIYGGWGLTTILLFWAALLRATREWGGDRLQGTAYGLLDGGRGLISAVIGTTTVAIFAFFLPTDLEVATVDMRGAAFRQVILFVASFVLLIAVLVWIGLRPRQSGVGGGGHRISLPDLARVARMPNVWLQAVIIVCAYTGYKVTDDFSLFAKEVMGYDEIRAANFGTLSLWVRPVATVGAGLLADRLSASRMILVCFAVMIAGGLAVGLGGMDPGLPGLFVLTILATSAGLFALRGLYFALTQEGKVPLALTGTAIGLMSVIGYTPDIFMGPLMGHLLDRSPGATGHQHVFLMMAGFASLGLLTTLVFRGVIRRKRVLEGEGIE